MRTLLATSMFRMLSIVLLLLLENKVAKIGADTNAGECDFVRLDARLPGASEKFSSDFRGKQPVILNGLITTSWPASTWTFEDWNNAFANISLPRRKLSTVSRYGGTHSVGHAGNADATFAFSTSLHDEAVEKLRSIGAMRPPAMLENASMRPVLSFGGIGEGLPYHRHDETWLALLYGAKRWFLRPPDDVPRKQSRVRAGLLEDEPGTSRCNQHAGEIMYFPENWWHATYNRPHDGGNLTIGVGGQGTVFKGSDMLMSGDVGGLERLMKKDKKFNMFIREEGGEWASEHGHVQMLDFVLQRMEDVFDARRTDDLVHIAAENGHLGILSRLLERRANLESDGHQSSKPLHQAAEAGHVAVISWLSDQRANLRSKTGDGQDALGLGCKSGHLEVLKWLIEPPTRFSQKDVRRQCWHAAVHGGHTHVVRHLLERRASLKSTSEFFSVHESAKKGHDETLSLLLSSRANANQKDSEGTEPLHYAALNGHVDVLPELLSHGAKIDNQDGRGASALHYATHFGHIQVLEWLLNQRAKLDSVSHGLGGHQVIHVAAHDGHVRALSSILASVVGSSDKKTAARRKRLVDTKNAHGIRPLHVAAQAGHVEVLEWLRKQGARPAEKSFLAEIRHAAVREWFDESQRHKHRHIEHEL